MHIYDTGSVSAAGHRLSLSQPASSNALSRLRTALDDPLFIRGKDGMLPTAYTERVIPEIRKHLVAIAHTLEKTSQFDPAHCKQTFQLSLSGLGESVFLARLARKLLQQAPNIRLENTEIASDLLPMALANSQVDIAIGIVEPKAPTLEHIALFKDDFVAIVKKTNAENLHGLAELQKKSLVVISPSATYAHSMEGLLERYELMDQVRIRLRHFGALPELLTDLDVVSIVPRQYAKTLVSRGVARILPIPLPYDPLKINLVWHRKMSDDPALSWFRSQVIDLFQQTDN